MGLTEAVKLMLFWFITVKHNMYELFCHIAWNVYYEYCGCYEWAGGLLFEYIVFVLSAATILCGCVKCH